MSDNFIKRSKSVPKFPIIDIKRKIEPLIRLFYFHKYLKELSPSSFKYNCYLIDKTSLTKYKSDYGYEELKEYLKILNKNNSLLISSSAKNVNIDNIIMNLPDKYIAKIKSCNKFEKLNLNENKYKSITIKTKKIIKVKVLYDYIIINEKIYDLLFSNFYNIKREFYKINNKYILINLNDCKYLEIGKLDENNIFIPEYFIEGIEEFSDSTIKYFINTNQFINIFKNKSYNYFKINGLNDYYECFKVIVEEKSLDISTLRSYDNIKNKDIIEIKKESKIDFDSYSCIKCNSIIELLSINIFGKNVGDKEYIEFRCTGKCQSFPPISIIKYLNEMIRNTYLYDNCCICGSIQLYKEKIFYFCTLCKKIFCEEDSCQSEHKCERINNFKFLKINEIKRICLEHPDNYFNRFCYDDEINLCETCLSEKQHINHNKENIIEINPIENMEEENIIQEIINYLKGKIEKISNEKIKILDKEREEEEEKINMIYIEKIHSLSTEKEKERNIVIKKYQNEIDNKNKEYYNEINNITNQIKEDYKKIISYLNNINMDNNIININENDINNKYELINNFFNDEQNYIKKKIKKLINQKNLLNQ